MSIKNCSAKGSNPTYGYIKNINPTRYVKANANSTLVIPKHTLNAEVWRFGFQIPEDIDVTQSIEFNFWSMCNDGVAGSTYQWAVTGIYASNEDIAGTPLTITGTPVSYAGKNNGTFLKFTVTIDANQVSAGDFVYLDFTGTGKDQQTYTANAKYTLA